MAGADATQMVCSTLMWDFRRGSRATVRRMLPGSARPEVSTMHRSMPSVLRRAMRSTRAVARSSWTSQQTQPFGRLSICVPPDIVPRIAPSTSTSPNSLTSTAVPAPAGDLRYLLRRVVLPAPRKPVSKVIGKTAFSGAEMLIF